MHLLHPDLSSSSTSRSNLKSPIRVLPYFCSSRAPAVLCVVLLLLAQFCSLVASQCTVEAVDVFDLTPAPGVPISTTVAESAFRYFWFKVEDEACTASSTCRLTVILTPIDNDVDLYVLPKLPTDDPKVSFPCPTLDETDLLWSENVGGDAIIVPGVVLGSQYLIIVATAGAGSGSFEILAETSVHRQGVNAIRLTNGLGMYGAVTGEAGDQYWYYQLPVTASTDQPQSMTVTLSIMYGQPALYVDIVATVSNTDYLSTTAGIVNSYLTIQPITASNNYYIAVYAAEPAAFFVTATAAPTTVSGDAPATVGSQRLRAGVPFPGTVSGDTQLSAYFNLPYNPATGSGDAIVFTLDITTLGGDADMYVSQTETGVAYPSAVVATNPPNYYWKGTQLYNDVVTISPTSPLACKQACFYTVAVVPWGTGTVDFTLTASTQGITTLLNGAQVRDSVPKAGEHFYRFTPLPGIASVTIIVSPSVGIVSAYIATANETAGTRKPYPDPLVATSYNKALSGVGELAATVTAAQGWFCGWANQTGTSSTGAASCSYYITVYASSVPTEGQDAQFTITATSASSSAPTGSSNGGTQPVLLTNSVQSTVFTAVQSSWSYYYLTLTGPDASLSLTLTSITGDVDLYYLYSDSATTLYPNSSNYAASAESQSAVDVILVEPAKAGYYWLAVNAFQTSTYRLSASIYNDSVLVDGVPLSSIVQQFQYKYYNFTVSNTTARLTVSLFKQVGEPDLYVASPSFIAAYHVLPNRTLNTQASETYYTDSIVVEQPELGTYVIAVYGFDTTLYTISASTREASRQLRESVGEAGSITADLPDYFRITVDRTAIALTVIVTVLSGDCVLYLSTVETQPGLANFKSTRTPIPDYSADAYGHDGLTVPNRYLTVGQIWYAGVTTASTCTYSIGYKAGSTELLQDGRAQGGTVIYNTYRYYRFSTSATAPYILTIGATPFLGTVSMYVVSSATITSIGQNGNGVTLQPNKTFFDIASNDFETSPVIVIQPGDKWYCSSAGVSNCTYWISILGTSNSTTSGAYSIVARTNRTTLGALLQNGVPQDGSLAAGQYAYYKFVQNFTAGAVIFTLTPRDVQSDPDIVVSCSPSNTQPTLGGGTNYSSATFGGDVIHIDSVNDPASCWVGTYYVGVFAGSGRPAQYSLLAQAFNATLDMRGVTLVTTNQQYTGLVTNQANAGSELQWRYYRYYPFLNGSAPGDITFTLTALYGDPDMYLTNSSTQLPATNFSIAKSTSIAGGAIIIPGANVCLACHYTIGVVGFTPSLFQLLVTVGAQTTQLIAGEPLRSRVAVGGSRLFVVSFVDHTELLTITVTSITGDADVYCSTHANVSVQSSQWASISTGTDVITITDAVPTTYYILVHGFYAAEFTIVAQLGATALVAGQPQHDFLSAGEYRLYAIRYVPPTGTEPDLIFSVTSTGGFRFVSMYVSHDTYPNASTAEWSNVYEATNDFGSFNLISIHSAKAFDKFYLRVEAQYNVQFDVTAYYGSVAPILSAGRFTIASVDEGMCNQYTAYVSASPTGVLPDVSLDFIESIGDVQLYVSFTAAPNATYWNLTSGHDSTTRTGHVGVDTSQLGRSISSSGTLTLYVAVCGVTDSTYSLSYTTNSIYLPINQPLTARTPLDINQPLYFFVQSQVAGAGQMSNLSLTILGAAVDGSQDVGGSALYTIFICNDQVVECYGVVQPDESNKAWSYTITNGQSLTLPRNTTSPNTGTYALSVLSSVPNVSLVFSVAQRASGGTFQSRVLADRERVVGEVLQLSSSYTTDYYQTRVAAKGTMSTVQLDVCQGAAHVYFSDTNAFPGTNSNKLSVVVNNGFPTTYTPEWTGQYFIAVTPNTAQELVYDIQVYAGDPPSLPYFDFSNRQVTVQQLGSGSLQVSIPSADVFASVAALGVVLQYVVYWAPYAPNQAHFATACGCNLVASAAASSQSSQSGATIISTATAIPSTSRTPITSEISGLLANSQYTVNVVARLIQSGVSSDLLTPALYAQAGLPYTAARFSNGGGGGVDSGTMAAIAIPVVLTVVAALAYLLYRNRQMKKELAGVEMQDVPRPQVIKAAGGGGFRARAAAKLNKAGGASKAGKTRYSTLLGLGGGAGEETGGRELSTNELGLDDDDVDVDMEDGVYANGGGGGGGGVGGGASSQHVAEEEQKYTLDLEHEESNREDILGLRV